MLEYIFFILGIFLLVKGADYLVDGSSSLAKKIKVPSLVIGLTVVAFGTSMPELVVNIIAALGGNGDIAFGNIVGSNIANILLILGLTASITPLMVKHCTVWKEIPFSLLAALVIFIFSSISLIDGLKIGSILRFEGLILILFFIIFLYYIVGLIKNSKEGVKEEQLKIKNLSAKSIGSYIILGLVSLYIGGKWTVEGAVALAKLIGLSEYFISLTIVAVGTSLPELVTSIIAALKKDIDLAVGNVIGSNIFNIFWVLGISSLITPISIPSFGIIDLSVLLVASFLLFLFLFIGKKHEVERWQGVIFVLLYILYIVYLILRG